jgi:hypothetical protein
MFFKIEDEKLSAANPAFKLYELQGLTKVSTPISLLSGGQERWLQQPIQLIPLTASDKAVVQIGRLYFNEHEFKESYSFRTAYHLGHFAASY